MKRTTICFLGVTMMNAIMSGQDLGRLRDDIGNACARVTGRFAVAWEDLGTGRTLGIDDTVEFHAASTMKIPVMIEAYRCAANGTLSLDDSLTIENEFTSIVDGSPYHLTRTDDSDPVMYGLAGMGMSVRDLIGHMITRSSNLATNMLVDYLGAANINATLRRMGVMSTNVRRGVEDQKAYDAGMNNVITAHDLVVMLKAIATGAAVSPEASAGMYETLLGQEFRDKIPALLPSDVQVANKTGSFHTVEHDAAIVTLPDGRRYVLVVLSSNLEDDAAGRRVIANVSRLVYDFMMKER